MFKALTPLLGIIVAVGLFFTYIQPTFKEVRAIQDETAEYTAAIEKAAELERRISELKAQQSGIALADLERLEALIPNRIDEVSVLIDIDALARVRRLALGDIQVSEHSKDESAPGQGPQGVPNQPAFSGAPSAVGGGADPEYNFAGASPIPATEQMEDQYSTIDIGFSVKGTYDNLRLFLADIERSLTLMEVTKLVLSGGDGDEVTFSMSIRLYSLVAPS